MKANARKPKRKKRRGALYWAALIAVWGALAAGLWVLLLMADLPDLEVIPPPGESNRVEVLDESGRLLAAYGAVYGDQLSFSEIPPVMVEAVLAIEDRRFFEHGALDAFGLLRAIAVNLASLEVRQGASTITQQLAKNLFLSHERTVARKVRELLLAIRLERRLSKEDILALYLNRVYFGSGAYGIDAASRRYFGHSARRLSLAEAAMLAGLVKAPSTYSPLGDPVAARGRAAVVVDAMVDAGVLDPAVAGSAKAAPAAIAASGLGGNVRYFTDWVVDAMGEILSPGAKGPFRVYTTLEAKTQTEASRALKAGLAGQGQARAAGNGAIVVLAPDGAIKAMVGGDSYAQSQFNRAAQARRQPGSAFKIAVYLAAFEAGFTPDSRMVDQPVEVEGWRPKNFDREYAGEVTLREAFARSINTVAVTLSEAAGRKNVAAMARRLGFEGEVPLHPSLALGAEEMTPLELAAMYAAIANGGHRAEPYAILEIRSGSGALLYRRVPAPQQEVLDRKRVAAITDLLVGAVEAGTGRAARIARPVAGKTGTSQDYRDAWFAGFTADYVAAVWVGNDSDAPMKGVTGGGLPAKIWADAMTGIHRGLPPRALPFLKDRRSFFDKLFSKD